MPIVIPDLSGISEGISHAGSALGGALKKVGGAYVENKQKEVRQQQSNNAYEAYEKSGGDPSVLAAALKEGNIPADMGFPLLKMAQAGAQNSGGSPGDQKAILTAATHSLEAERGGNILQELRDMVPDLLGPAGYLQAIFKVGSAPKFNALGLASIEPVLKIFNPRGMIPMQKLVLVKEEYAPSAGDSRWEIRGKLDALEFINNEGKKMAAKQLALAEKYGENIPASEIINLDREAGEFIDSLIGNRESVGQEGGPSLGGGGGEGKSAPTKSFDKLPDPKKFKGKTFLDDEGNKVRSNGKRFVKVS